MELKKPEDTLLEDMMRDAVTDAALFCTYDDDFEIIDRDQVMRCLANLDKSIKNFNMIFDDALIYRDLPVSALFNARIPIDAIFTALRIMQDNLKSAVEHEAEKALNNRIGG